jgi:hypothetical protein
MECGSCLCFFIFYFIYKKKIVYSVPIVFYIGNIYMISFRSLYNKLNAKMTKVQKRIFARTMRHRTNDTSIKIGDEPSTVCRKAKKYLKAHQQHPRQRTRKSSPLVGETRKHRGKLSSGNSVDDRLMGLIVMALVATGCLWLMPKGSSSSKSDSSSSKSGSSSSKSGSSSSKSDSSSSKSGSSNSGSQPKYSSNYFTKDEHNTYCDQFYSKESCNGAYDHDLHRLCAYFQHKCQPIKKKISFVDHSVSREYPINISVPNSETRIIKDGKDERGPVYGTSDYQYPQYILSQLSSSSS